MSVLFGSKCIAKCSAEGKGQSQNKFVFECHRLHLRRAVATLDHLHDGVTKIGRTERVHKRVQAGVDVRHPERGRVQVFGHYGRVGEADVEHKVERHPTDHVGEYDVRQRDERFSTFVHALLLVLRRRVVLRWFHLLPVSVGFRPSGAFFRRSMFGVFASDVSDVIFPGFEQIVLFSCFRFVEISGRFPGVRGVVPCLASSFLCFWRLIRHLHVMFPKKP